MFKQLCLATLVCLLFASSNANAGIIAQWTFETSIPTNAGPLAPEIDNATGSPLALASNGDATFSNPAGNGSVESWSATNWNVNDYWGFTVNTSGFSDIGVTFSATSSNTGPRDFQFTYRVGGAGAFTVFSNYTVIPNAAPPGAWNATTPFSAYDITVDLRSITALNNAAIVDFRLVNSSTTSANGGTVAAGGTSRIDNFTILDNFTPVPEPTSYLLAAFGAVSFGLFQFRKKRGSFFLRR